MNSFMDFARKSFQLKIYHIFLHSGKQLYYYPSSQIDFLPTTTGRAKYFDVKLLERICNMRTGVDSANLNDESFVSILNTSDAFQFTRGCGCMLVIHNNVLSSICLPLQGILRPFQCHTAYRQGIQLSFSCLLK